MRRNVDRRQRLVNQASIHQPLQPTPDTTSRPVSTQLKTLQEQEAEAEAIEEKTLLLSPDEYEAGGGAQQHAAKAELQAILEAERHTPWVKVRLLVFCFVVVLVLNLFKGGGHFPSPLGVECGSFAFWFITLMVFAWVIGISLYVRQDLIKVRHQGSQSGVMRVYVCVGSIASLEICAWVNPTLNPPPTTGVLHQGQGGLQVRQGGHRVGRVGHHQVPLHLLLRRLLRGHVRRRRRHRQVRPLINTSSDLGPCPSDG